MMQRIRLSVLVAISVLMFSSIDAAPQGFGSQTPGGAGQPVYRVTTLRDGGPGSLRDAVSEGYREIHFAVAGEIALSRDLWVKGPFVTIDGTSAPPPGITLKGRALLIHRTHDVIVRGIRSRQSQGCDKCGSTGAGFGIGSGASHIVLEYVSAAGAQDSAMGIGDGAHDITVQWSIFAESQSATGKKLPVLIGYRARRVSFHHNFIIDGYERMPMVMWSHDGDRATDTQADVRQNLLWDWDYAATYVWKGSQANVVGNYYYDPDATLPQQRRAIFLKDARAYIAHNVSGHGSPVTQALNRLSTEPEAFPAPALPTSDACTAALEVLGRAGVRPLDRMDAGYVRRVDQLRGCDQRPLDGPLPAPMGLRIAVDAAHDRLLDAPSAADDPHWEPPEVSPAAGP